LQVEVSMDIDGVPLIRTKWTLEEQKTCFLKTIGEKNTGVFIKIHIFPS
jgi:hypothetical protein